MSYCFEFDLTIDLIVENNEKWTFNIEKVVKQKLAF